MGADAERLRAANADYQRIHRKKKKKQGLNQYEVHIYPRHLNMLRRFERESRRSKAKGKVKTNDHYFDVFTEMKQACPIDCTCAMTTQTNGDVLLEWNYVVNGEPYNVSETMEPDGTPFVKLMTECSDFMIDQIAELM
jgi:hypothetical protein